MEFDTLNAMNEGMYLSLQRLMEIVMLITVLLAFAGFATYLAGVAWFWFEGKRRSITAPQVAPPRTNQAPSRQGQLLIEPTTQSLFSYSEIQEFQLKGES